MISLFSTANVSGVQDTQRRPKFKSVFDVPPDQRAAFKSNRRRLFNLRPAAKFELAANDARTSSRQDREKVLEAEAAEDAEYHQMPIQSGKRRIVNILSELKRTLVNIALSFMPRIC